MQFERLAALDLAVDPFVGGAGPVPANRARRIEGLRITFQVKADRDKGTNTADISVYNLAEASRNAIRGRPDSGKPGTAITLWVGYGDAGGLQVLFRGYATEVGHTFDPPEVRTRIQVNTDAADALATRATLSFSEGELTSTVLKKVIELTGLPLDHLAAFQDGSFLQGFAFEGPVRAALDKVTARLGLEWSNQNGRLRVLQRGKSTGRQTVALSPTSGLLGSPERLWRTLDDPAAAQKPTGWKARCLLQPLIVPGDLVGIRSREIDPAMAFVVQNVCHDGDTHGENWTTTFECLDEGARAFAGPGNNL